MDDIAREFAELLACEKAKEPYYTEPIEARQVLVDAFMDHVIVLQNAGSVTINDLLSSADDENQNPFDEAFYVRINELIQIDLVSCEIPLSGEMHVSGEGIYVTIPNDEDAELAQGNIDPELYILANGEVIIGEIGRYVIGPMIPHARFIGTCDSENDTNAEMPSLLLCMEDAIVVDEDGVTIRSVGNVVVPLDYPSLQFRKLVRQRNSMSLETRRKREWLDMKPHFTSDSLREFCADIENSLNYNEYSEKKIRAEREAAQRELEFRMKAVDLDAQLRLTVSDARLINGESTSYTNQAAFYLGTVLTRLPNLEWRVAHAFYIATTGSPIIAHVLPENIEQVLSERNE